MLGRLLVLVWIITVITTIAIISIENSTRDHNNRMLRQSQTHYLNYDARG